MSAEVPLTLYEASVSRDKLERIRDAARHALDVGSATGSGTTLAAKIIAILEGT